MPEAPLFTLKAPRRTKSTLLRLLSRPVRLCRSVPSIQKSSAPSFELGVEARVRFAGAAHGEEKARLLAQADVLLLPSYSEGLPYALLEAMAAGVVPVVTRVGAIPDVVDAGTHGLFVPVRDAAAIAQALEALEADRAWLARMSAACRKRIASAYSLERVAAEFGGLYAALVAARTPKTIL